MKIPLTTNEISILTRLLDGYLRQLSPTSWDVSYTGARELLEKIGLIHSLLQASIDESFVERVLEYIVEQQWVVLSSELLKYAVNVEDNDEMRTALSKLQKYVEKISSDGALMG